MEKNPELAKHIEAIGKELEALKKQGVMTSYFFSFMKKINGADVWAGGQISGKSDEMMVGILHLMQQIERETDTPVAVQLLTLAGLVKYTERRKKVN